MINKDSSIIKFFASLRITVICLLWLCVLIIWGTLYQVDHGLYSAQEKFFDSYYFFVYDFIPIPSTQLIMWILFFNLLTVLAFKTNYNLQKLWINFTHFTILLLMLSCFFISNTAVESFITLGEGEKTNKSSDYYSWELLTWQSNSKQASSFNIDSKSKGKSIQKKDLGIEIVVDDFYINSSLINSSNLLLKTKPETEYSNNIAGAKLTIKDPKNQKSFSLVLHGTQAPMKSLEINKQKIFFSLRKKQYTMPISIQLIDFQKEEHLGTEIAKSYLSWVRVEDKNGSRKLKISMNKPLRHGPYTFYQASYLVDEGGNEFSTLAVVKNHGRLLPYIFSLLTTIGLILYFLLKLVRFKLGENGN